MTTPPVHPVTDRRRWLCEHSASQQKEFGGFWSADAPTSMAQVRTDKAILSERYNKKTLEITDYSPIDRGYTAKFSEGALCIPGR